MSLRPLACLMVVFPCFTTMAQEPVYSELWGANGEKWSPQSRLPDYSFAGYRCGEAEIPEPEVVAKVTDFGAVGNDDGDDTQAFLAAIDATERGAILIPAGRYKISGILEIHKPELVLRGEGPNQSVLEFTKPLNEIRPNWGATTGGRRTSNYSWSGGLVWIKGNFQSKKIADVTAPAERGAQTLSVSTTEGMKVGQWIEIFQEDDKQKTLTHHLYSGDSGDISKHRGARVSLVTRLTDVSPEAIQFERPLRWDVRTAWSPVVRQFKPTVHDVGVENLGFEFPADPYRGHFTELGFNAIAMSNVANCWAQNLRINNSDSGLFIGAKFCTIRNVVVESSRKAFRGDTGHHGIILGGTDNLFSHFDFRTKFIHDLGLSANHAGNVFANGKGVDLAFDHHKRAPHENLFTNIDVGAGNRIWNCGGGASLGKNCGARGTFWNVRAAKPIAYPPDRFGPESIILVGVQTNVGSIKDLQGRWMESISPRQLHPPNLYQAQLQRRLKSK